MCICFLLKNHYTRVHRVVIKSRGGGFSPATKRVAPGYFYWKIEKIEQKEIPGRLIPRLFVVFTGQLEISVTTLVQVEPKPL